MAAARQLAKTRSTSSLGAPGTWWYWRPWYSSLQQEASRDAASGEGGKATASNVVGMLRARSDAACYDRV